MHLAERVATWLLRRTGYRLTDVWDSWKLILADRTGEREDNVRRILFEHLLYSRLSEFLKSRKCDLVIDVGSYVGRFAGRLRRTGYTGPLLLVEPVPDLASRLEGLGGNDANWHVRRTAVGATEGDRRLHLAHDRSFSSFLLPNEYSRSEFGELSAVTESVAVTVRRLDSLIDEYVSQTQHQPESVFIKTDTQGLDLEAIGSLGQWRSRVVGLLTEVPVRNIYRDAPTFEESLTWYRENRFSLADIFPVSYAARGSVVEVDCFFISQESAESA